MLIKLLKDKWNAFKEKNLIFETQENLEEKDKEDAETNPEDKNQENPEDIKKAGEETGSELLKALKPFEEIAETIAKPLTKGKETLIQLGKSKNAKEFQENAASYYKEVSKKLSPEELKKYDDLREKAKEISITELQGGHEWLGLTEENYEKKYSEISKAYLSDLKNGSFKVKPELDDNETVKMNLGAGDILPPSVIAAEITDTEGNTRRGKRMIQNGRVGYYDESGYIPIFGNYIIRPIESINETSNEYKSAVNSEKENYKAMKERNNREKSLSSKEAPLPTQDYYKNYETNPSNYPEEYFKKTKHHGDIPKPLRNDEREIKMMPHNDSIKYLESHMGPYATGWKTRVDVFGQKNIKTNIVLACLMLELEDRCRKMGMNENFYNISSSNTGKSRKKGRTTFHGMAMAVDFDPKNNYLGDPKTGEWDIPMALVYEAQKMGFRWGMYFHDGRADGKTDPMHFEFRGTIAGAMSMLKSPQAITQAQSFIVPGTKMNLIQYANSPEMQKEQEEIFGKKIETTLQTIPQAPIQLEEITAPPNKLKPNEFINKYKPLADWVEKTYKIPAAICLAQAALETGWGGSGKAINQNNFFGMTKGGKSKGFHEYNNVFSSFKHYGSLISGNNRYSSIVPWNEPKNYNKWAIAIENGGYSSAGYGNKVMGVLQTLQNEGLS